MMMVGPSAFRCSKYSIAKLTPEETRLPFQCVLVECVQAMVPILYCVSTLSPSAESGNNRSWSKLNLSRSCFWSTASRMNGKKRVTFLSQSELNRIDPKLCDHHSTRNPPKDGSCSELDYFGRRLLQMRQQLSDAHTKACREGHQCITYSHAIDCTPAALGS